MKYTFLIISLLSSINIFAQIEKYDFPDTLMVYGSSNGDYGLTPKNPIKVGGGILPKHIYRYLNSLVDSNGTKIRYERIGSCCTEEIGRSKPLTSFKVFPNSNDTALIVYFDLHTWDYPKILSFANWKEKRQGYYGDYLNDSIFNGSGVYFFDDGGYYQGNWKNGMMEGQGKMYIPEQETYFGSFTNGVYNGYGKIDYNDGGEYYGEWSNGKRQGNGVLKYPKGMEIISIEGPFVNDKPSGEFNAIYKDGKTGKLKL